jgi:hypothetical protein
MTARIRPSLARRAFVALAVLVGFYATTILIALALLPVPVVAFLLMKKVHVWGLLAVTACSWVPARLLLSGVFGVRPPPFEEPGRRLERADAPGLFALIDNLAAGARTAPPADVYLSPEPVAFVTETGGGFFGSKSRRVLCIGAPILATSTSVRSRRCSRTSSGTSWVATRGRAG